MKKKELYELRKAIIDCKSLQGAKFSYGLVKNFDEINKEIKLIEQSKKELSEKASLFLKEQDEVFKKHTQKDEKGNPVLKGEGFEIIDVKALNEDLEKLKEQHKGAIEEITKYNDDFNKLMDSEADFKPYKIKIDDVDDKISTSQMAGIKCLIE